MWRLGRNTVHDAALNPKCFDELNLDGAEEEDFELLRYHSRLLTAHLSTTFEMHHFFCAYPWRAAAALLEKHVPTILKEMKLEWEFVLNCVDKLGAKDRAAVLLQHTRFQVYRDLFTKAESFALK